MGKSAAANWAGRWARGTSSSVPDRASDERRRPNNGPECEVCYAKWHETPLYRHGGSVYCEQDLNRAINEKWHPGSKKITEIKR
jgi:hypothetical protein